MLLLDNSAWARLDSPAIPDPRLEEISEMILEGELAVCAPFLLEAGFSARDAAEHHEISRRLLQLPRVSISEAVERLALKAQVDLAAVGHHRSAVPIDLLIAACAHEAGAGVLHYDHHYDLLARHTMLRFESQWLAPAGDL